MGKYKLWWRCCVGIAIFFGLGLLCFLAFGVTYLYIPHGEKYSQPIFWTLQTLAAAFFGFVSVVATLNNDHLKGGA